MVKINKKLSIVLSSVLTVCIIGTSSFYSHSTIANAKTLPLPPSSILNCANQLILNQQKNDKTCRWTSSTKAGEIINTYDLDGNINGFIINLKTNGKDSGYVVINNDENNPSISEFGYDNKYYLQQNPKFNNIKGKKIINLGNENYFYIDNSILKDAYTEEDVSSYIPKLKSQYDEYKLNTTNNSAASINSIKNTAISPLPQVIFSSYSLPQLWVPTTYTPLTVDDFQNEPGITKKGW